MSQIVTRTRHDTELYVYFLCFTFHSHANGFTIIAAVLPVPPVSAAVLPVPPVSDSWTSHAHSVAANY